MHTSTANLPHLSVQLFAALIWHYELAHGLSMTVVLERGGEGERERES
jgi:hypothetical protein